jgi:hypothetical protein
VPPGDAVLAWRIRSRTNSAATRQLPHFAAYDCQGGGHLVPMTHPGRPSRTVELGATLEVPLTWKLPMPYPAPSPPVGSWQARTPPELRQLRGGDPRVRRISREV